VILSILPVKRLRGRIHLPASKSYSIRAFIIAARGGVSRVLHASDSEDAAIALSTAKDLGAVVKVRGNGRIIKASPLKVRSKIFFVGESGTTLRFLLPLLAMHTCKARVRGKGTLLGRPNAHLCETLRRQGMDIKGLGKKESVPIVYQGGELTGGRVLVDGSLSSQFISALLIALPSLKVNSRIILTGREMVSADYIRMTVEILAKAGIVIKRISQREYAI
jgi:3-phosphoshikimate 1-carboxyvinyltransferase